MVGTNTHARTRTRTRTRARPPAGLSGRGGEKERSSKHNDTHSSADRQVCWCLQQQSCGDDRSSSVLWLLHCIQSNDLDGRGGRGRGTETEREREGGENARTETTNEETDRTVRTIHCVRFEGGRAGRAHRHRHTHTQRTGELPTGETTNKRTDEPVSERARERAEGTEPNGWTQMDRGDAHALVRETDRQRATERQTRCAHRNEHKRPNRTEPDGRDRPTTRPAASAHARHRRRRRCRA
jgi:hypothetical protein